MAIERPVSELLADPVRGRRWTAWWPATQVGGMLWGAVLALSLLRAITNAVNGESGDAFLVDATTMAGSNYIVMVFIRWIALVIPHNAALVAAKAAREEVLSSTSLDDPVA